MKKLILLILCAVGVAIIFLFYRSSPKQVSPTPPKEVEQIPSETEYLGSTTLPPELPTNLPMEKDVPLVRNEIIKVDGGKEIQNVRMYYSKKTVKQNFDIYKKYLTDNDWKIIFQQSDSNMATLLAEKAGNLGTFSISISKNSITEDVTVELNVVVK